MLQGLVTDESTQNQAEMVMQEAETVLTSAQLLEADDLYADWYPGQCELELIPKFQVAD